MSYETIKIENDGKVRIIKLCRPDVLNAMNRLMMNELLTALDEAEQDSNVRVVVFTGEGRGFCAGADLSGGDTFKKGGKEDPMEFRDGGGLVTLRLYEMKKPVIAAINGAAVGVGVTMTLPMDIRIASSKAKFGFVFARRGIVSESCSSYFLPRVVNISQAMEWMMTGRVFKADEALRGGLVSRVVEPDELLPTALGIAHEIADNTSAVSVAMIKQMGWRLLGAQHPMDAHELESQTMQWIGSQPDAVEGVASFLEKRDPNFTMTVTDNMPYFYPWWPERTFRNK